MKLNDICSKETNNASIFPRIGIISQFLFFFFSSFFLLVSFLTAFLSPTPTPPHPPHSLSTCISPQFRKDIACLIPCILHHEYVHLIQNYKCDKLYIYETKFLPISSSRKLHIADHLRRKKKNFERKKNPKTNNQER